MRADEHATGVSRSLPKVRASRGGRARHTSGMACSRAWGSCSSWPCPRWDSMTALRSPEMSTVATQSGWRARGRAADTVSYFTEWSNVVVAIALLMLWREPTRDTYWRRVLRADSLMMITVTALVYAVLLAPTQRVTGWSVFTNPLQHIVVPMVTVVVFLVWGPRGWFSWRVIAGSLLIPAAWVVWMLVRGVAVGAYPYDFVDPTTYGYPAVLATIGKILVFGTLISLLFWGIDRALMRWRGR